MENTKELLVGGTLMCFGSAMIKGMYNYSKNNPPDKCVFSNLCLTSIGVFSTGLYIIYENI
jgi:hypothetical protein